MLADVAGDLDADAVAAVMECGLSSTEAAIRNPYPLPDFAEYPAWGSL